MEPRAAALLLQLFSRPLPRRQASASATNGASTLSSFVYFDLRTGLLLLDERERQRSSRSLAMSLAPTGVERAGGHGHSIGCAVGGGAFGGAFNCAGPPLGNPALCLCSLTSVGGDLALEGCPHWELAFGS